MSECEKRSIFRRAYRAYRANKTIRRVMVVALLVLAMLLTATVTTQVTKTATRTVDLRFQNIGELATQSAYYTNVQTISNVRQVFGIDVPFTDSKYIYSYDGIIKAGIDFSQISIETDEISNTITVICPEIVVLGNELKPDSLVIYDEKKSPYTPLSLNDIGESQSKLLSDAQENAIANGLFENAQQNAEVLLFGMLSGIYDLSSYEVRFKWQESDIN